ncbi:hypothetical protein [Melissospora conviva]|uniref:hypothetical protein n=1 Tax=Melissospora conviva TaxID=3388432 RepID=UPI003B7F3752
MITLAPGRAAVDPAAALAPVTTTLRGMFGTDRLPGLAPGLVVTDESGWRPAGNLIHDGGIADFVAAAVTRWQGSRHVCAGVAWKAYSYWLALPAVLGWAGARRVPLLDPADVLVDFADHRPAMALGLRPQTRIAVLPTDPLALAGDPRIHVVADEAALLAVLRESLLDRHFTPMITALQTEVRLGTRVLHGSIASGVAYAILQAADALPGSSLRTIDTLLETLGMSDLIEISTDAHGLPAVQRRTCCLAARLPQPKVCPGCCIRTA